MDVALLEQHFETFPDITSVQITLPDLPHLSIDCLRLDATHPFISGNKWYKLKHHLAAFSRSNKRVLLSFGGAYSNHLHALAYAGKVLGIATQGVVRGEQPNSLSPTLQDCADWGMQLEWVNRQDYRQMAPADSNVNLYRRYPEAWIVPEGGGGAEGLMGVRELFLALEDRGLTDYDCLVCPVGSGTTLAGIVAAGLRRPKVLGVSALKGAFDLEQQIDALLKDFDGARANWELCHDYHFGGFAKLNPRLKQFISDIYDGCGLVLDPVYTSKALYAVLERVKQGRIGRQAKILLVHTGGLQGWRGFAETGPHIGHDH